VIDVRLPDALIHTVPLRVLRMPRRPACASA
jgi:hypothetical protein